MSDMDLVSSSKDKLMYFRIKELKDVLSQLGLPKQGKKQDLVDRIVAILSDEQVPGMWAKKYAVGKEDLAKLVDDTYRKMQVSGATELASKGPGVSGSCNTGVKVEIDDSHEVDKIRCPCGSSLQTDSMIKCEDQKCHVWQHVGCVIIPEKPTDGVLPAPPEIFFCEICRLRRADPFWTTVTHPLYPVKLTTTNVPTDGTNPVQSVEKTFQLSRVDKELLAKQEYDVQAWCMLLNDKVSFRMQWPQFADLQVNGIPVRAINRPGSQMLGANGRDDGPVITPCTSEGINKISLTGCDSRVFCLGVRLVKRRTVQQILNLIPKESDGEVFEDALARVRRCVGGGTPTENADSDSDLEIVADSIPVKLRCPMSGLRMKVAGRFKPCLHMGCFDLEVFVEMNQRSRKWQCPVCLKNYALENIIIDPYFNRITSKMRHCEEDVTEIEVKPDGSWRAKADSDRRDLGDIGQWHLPDGTLYVPDDVEASRKSEALKQIKQEGVSEGHYSPLKIGIKKNQKGLWEVSKHEDIHAVSSGNGREKCQNHGQNVVPMSSSATGSEDLSVNQDGGVNFDFPANNGIELDHACGFTSHNSALLGDAEVIVLSDSEEENDNMISSGTLYKNNQTDAGGSTFSVPPHGIADSYPEYPSTVVSSCLDLFNANDDEFGMSMWSLPPDSQAGPGFQLFGSDADVSDALVDLQHSSINCPTSMNGYAGTAMRSAAFVPESSSGHSNADVNDCLVDNPLAFGDDPSLQIFLPTRPSDASMQPNLRDQPDVSNCTRTDDWISLRLGGGAISGHGEAEAANGLNSQCVQAKEGAKNPMAETASLLLGTNDNRSGLV
ncbi:E3 SUMO-protein ligase SIZ1-like isoform X2 [Rhododendron vialii]|uniref:E3 SUMO-protein ligase SIZ1-like isoform X2 n=1 Tax=Rhododendron vialii TaxID=182163 RepID=UPI00265EB264|nr:E3 SUMO-protein ligase SIZ1-like isoform X2 [Rhododendron vialii]